MPFVLLGLFLAVLPFVLAITSVVMQVRLRTRLRYLEEALEQYRSRVEALSGGLQQARKELADLKAARADTPPPIPTPAPPAAAAPPKPPVPPPSRPPIPVPSPPPVKPVPQPESVPAAPAFTPPPPPPPIAPAPAARFDWEQLVGVKLFSAIAGVALVLAAVFFLRYSIDHGWLSPPVRATIGLVTGIGLLVGCELRAARRYPVTANALDAAGIAILFATVFASHALWRLIPAGVAFVLLAMVTAAAVLLSIRRSSLFIAVLGLLGGFATPVLLSTGENRPVPLFTYILLLNIGLAWVAANKRWPLLRILTLILTALYQWGWVMRFLTASQLPLAMGIFIVFALAGLGAMVMSGRKAADSTPFGERVDLLVTVMPLLFAVYLAAIPAYGLHAGLLFGFLLLIAAALFAISVARVEESAHAVGGAATVLVFAVWLANSYAHDAWWTAVAFVCAFVVFYAVAPMIARRIGRPLSGLSVNALYAAPVLLLVFPVIARVEPSASALGLFAPLFGLLAVLAWRALAEPAFALYLAAGFFGVAALEVWTARHLSAGEAGVAMILYGSFATYHFAVPMLARRMGRATAPVWGSAAVLVASLTLPIGLSFVPTDGSPFWGLGVLLAILTAGVFIDSGATRPHWGALAASVWGWLVMASWWDGTAGAAGVLPALLTMVALTLVMLAGYTFLTPGAPAPRSAMAARGAGFRQGTYLGLLGHFFLLFIALNPEWSTPPWPLFGALAVVTLAVSATSVATGIGELHAGGAFAASFVMLAWAGTSAAAWWTWKVIAGECAVAYALVSFAAVRRRSMAHAAAVGAALAIAISELTLIQAGEAPDAAMAVIAPAHVINLSVVLALAWMYGWRWVSVAAVVPAWLAALDWQADHGSVGDWVSAMALAAALYAVFTAYPFVLGRRARESRDPYLTAIAGAVFFFFAARSALLLGGYDRFFGAVPVAEGLVMAVLLRALLRMEPAGSRDLGRLAFVAGSALGFATVAIPVQLQHQWITIGWALEGMALALLYRRVPHRGLLAWSVALLMIVFARLALNPSVLAYEPRGYRVFNWYLYTYLIGGASLLGAGWALAKTDDRLTSFVPRASTLLPVGGVIVLFLLLNIEIADYYAVGPEIALRFGVSLAQDLTYTLGWLLFGLALLAACIYLRIRAGRVAAVVLIAVTTCKAFLYDMGSLGGLYRVFSLMGLAVCLSLVALALQKYVLQESHGQ